MHLFLSGEESHAGVPRLRGVRPPSGGSVRSMSIQSVRAISGACTAPRTCWSSRRSPLQPLPFGGGKRRFLAWRSEWWVNRSYELVDVAVVVYQVGVRVSAVDPGEGACSGPPARDQGCDVEVRFPRRSKQSYRDRVGRYYGRGSDTTI